MAAMAAGAGGGGDVAAVDRWRWLASTYMVEYHVEGHVARLPAAWRAALESTTLREVAARLLGDHGQADANSDGDSDDRGSDEDEDEDEAPGLGNHRDNDQDVDRDDDQDVDRDDDRDSARESAEKTLTTRPAVAATMVWPLGLLTYAALCEQLALDRRPRPVGVVELHAVLRVGLTAKKQHEIERVVPLVRKLATATGARLVVDIGSGVGHLARALAYEASLDVLGLEGSAPLVEAAHEHDRRCRTALDALARRDPKTAALLQRAGVVRHLHRRVPTSLDPAALEALVAEGLSVASAAEDAPVTPSVTPPLILVGLHTCGDLGPTLLRQFLEAASVRAVVSVGCCYMHLTEPGAAAADAAAGILGPAKAADAAAAAPVPRSGYPLSQRYAAMVPRSQLGWKLREMACHSLDAYRARCRGPPEKLLELRTHGYRAALEVLVRRLDPSAVRPALGSLKGGWAMPFRAYATKALERLGYAADAARLRDLDWQPYEALAAAWEEPAKFFCLRVALSPVLETILLRDRLCWLREHGHAAHLRALFDPQLSPRNFAIYAAKPP